MSHVPCEAERVELEAPDYIAKSTTRAEIKHSVSYMFYISINSLYSGCKLHIRIALQIASHFGRGLNYCLIHFYIFHIFFIFFLLPFKLLAEIVCFFCFEMENSIQSNALIKTFPIYNI